MRTYCRVWQQCLVVVLATFGLFGHAGTEPITFRFQLDKPALTSAGIFDKSNVLQRVLWTAREMAAGEHSAEWDGKDEYGESLLPRKYHLQVVVNRSSYRNVGAIGNSGVPPDRHGHVPASIDDIAVDSEGAVYAANWWDESGADFKKWSASGDPVYDANYQVRNGTPNGLPYAIAVDDDYLYCSVTAVGSRWKSRQHIQRYRRSDGRREFFTGADLLDGHITVHELPSEKIPEGTSSEEIERLKYPLRSLAVVGEHLVVADLLGDRVLVYHRGTGAPVGQLPIAEPRALAVDKKGRLWIGHGNSISHFGGRLDKLPPIVEMTRKKGEGGAKGPKVTTVLTDVGRVRALAFGPRYELYVADGEADQVKIYKGKKGRAELVGTIGQKAVPGDHAADRYYDLRSLAVDKEGNLFTSQRLPIAGARLAKWSPEGELLWEHFCLEVVSSGNYHASDPDRFYSMSLHQYQLGERDAGKWAYQRTLSPNGVSYHAGSQGVPRVIKVQGKPFFYTPTGDGVQIYRIGEKQMSLVSLVGGRKPFHDGSHVKAGGQWSWSDAKGTGVPKPDELLWFSKPEQGGYRVFGMDVDRKANIWFANLSTRSIWKLPLRACDERGNPKYNWQDVEEMVYRDRSSFDFYPTMAQAAPDGTIYAFGWSSRWPQPKNNPAWMGGTTLVRFEKDGDRMWAIGLPEVCVGLDIIPEGGCMLGACRTATVFHVHESGLLIGQMKPGEAMGFKSGWLDNHASVAVNRDPRDGLLDVFVEDDGLLRIGWYRVDDRDIAVIKATATD